MNTNNELNGKLIKNETVIVSNKKKYSTKKIILCFLGFLLVVSGISIAIYLLWNERKKERTVNETETDKDKAVDIEKPKTKEIEEIPRTKEFEKTSTISSNPETTFEDGLNKTLEEEEKKDTATEEKIDDFIVENTDATTSTQPLESNDFLFKKQHSSLKKDVTLSEKATVENVTVDCDLFWYKCNVCHENT